VLKPNNIESEGSQGVIAAQLSFLSVHQSRAF